VGGESPTDKKDARSVRLRAYKKKKHVGALDRWCTSKKEKPGGGIRRKKRDSDENRDKTHRPSCT